MSEHLANERTFLAWIRTSIAVISPGFVVAKFGVWLHELSVRLSPNIPNTSSGLSLPIGIAMMSLGAIMAILAGFHYHAVRAAIDRGEAYMSRGLVNAVAAAIVALAVLMIAYLVAATFRI